MDGRGEVGLLIVGDFEFRVGSDPFPHRAHRSPAGFHPLGSIEVGIVYDDVASNGNELGVEVEFAKHVTARMQGIENYQNLLVFGARGNLVPRLPAGTVSFDEVDATRQGR